MSMNLTPRDIQEQVFKIKFRGFDPEEVDLFLEEVAENLHGLLQENDRLHQQITQLEQVNQEYRSQEQEIRSALLTARQAADLLVNQARQEAKKLKKQASPENSLKKPGSSGSREQTSPPDTPAANKRQTSNDGVYAHCSIQLTPELIPVADPKEEHPNQNPPRIHNPGLVPDFGFTEQFPGPAITFGNNEEKND